MAYASAYTSNGSGTVSYTQDPGDQIGSGGFLDKFTNFNRQAGTFFDNIVGFLTGARDAVTGTKIKTEVGVNKNTSTIIFGAIGLIFLLKWLTSGKKKIKLFK